MVMIRSLRSSRSAILCAFFSISMRACNWVISVPCRTGGATHSLSPLVISVTQSVGLAQERQQGVWQLDGKLENKLCRLGERADKVQNHAAGAQRARHRPRCCRHGRPDHEQGERRERPQARAARRPSPAQRMRCADQRPSRGPHQLGGVRVQSAGDRRQCHEQGQCRREGRGAQRRGAAGRAATGSRRTRTSACRVH
jgi:hypothetical protein